MSDQINSALSEAAFDRTFRVTVKLRTTLFLLAHDLDQAREVLEVEYGHDVAKYNAIQEHGEEYELSVTELAHVLLTGRVELDEIEVCEAAADEQVGSGKEEQGRAVLEAWPPVKYPGIQVVPGKGMGARLFISVQ